MPSQATPAFLRPFLRRLGLLIFPLILAAQTPVTVPPADTVPPPPPPPPDHIPLSLFALADDLEITLWAKAPQLRNPTNMDIDAQGRIWVTEGVNYRRHSTRETAGDHVMILEDTDGDGRADSSRPFVQEPTLLAPLGIAVIDNRIFVSNTPDLVVYTDVDRNGAFDGRVDKREVLLTGFNGRNHDHSLHSVTFGPDGLLYLNQGNAGALVTDRSGRTFRVGGSYDPLRDGGTPMFGWKTAEIAGARSDDGHVYVGGFAMRMKPDGTNLEIIGHNFRNSYEQTVTSFGDIFQNDNDDPPAARTAFLIEHGNLGFFSLDGSRIWSADRRPGQTTPIAEWRQDDPHTIPAGDVYGGGAPTGIVSYEGDALGEKWRGLLISCEAARNTLFGYFPKADGAGYDLQRFDFLTTNRQQEFAGADFTRGRAATELKVQFRPSDVAVGPDGAIYVADWFDARVGGHQDLDSQTAGAIYRIAPKGFKSVIPKFDLATTAGQIAALKNPAPNVRALGFERLRAQGAAAVAPTSALLADANPFIRARAIFLLAQLGAEGVAAVEAQLNSTDAQTRVAAYRALRRSERATLAHATRLAADVSPAVRREVALALRDVPFDGARELLLILAKAYDGRDRSYLAAWGIGATGKEAPLYTALDATQPEKNPAKWSAAYAQLVWKLTPAAAVPAFAARASALGLTDAERLAATTALGFIPTRAAAFALLDLAEKSTGAPQTHALWWLLNYRSTRWAGQGIDAELKTRGLYDPEKIQFAASILPPAPATALPPVAEIALLKGDAARGAGLLAACYLCHRIGANGVDYAPNLTGFASRQTTEVVINAIVNPSSEISHGYDGTSLTLHDDTVIDGLILSTGDPVIVQSSGGVKQLIPASKIKSRTRLNRSLMLSADQLGLKPQDIADLVAHLKTQ